MFLKVVSVIYEYPVFIFDYYSRKERFDSVSFYNYKNLCLNYFDLYIQNKAFRPKIQKLVFFFSVYNFGTNFLRTISSNHCFKFAHCDYRTGKI